MKLDFNFRESQETFNLNFGEVQNAGGSEGGGNGEDGFSPIATVTQTADGAVITITDKYGTTTATVTNGEDGKDGEDGKNGTDGKDGVDGQNGKDGYTPQKGIDYYTPKEKAELVEEISRAVTGDIETALDGIIAIQNELIGGDGND